MISSSRSSSNFIIIKTEITCSIAPMGLNNTQSDMVYDSYILFLLQQQSTSTSTQLFTTTSHKSCLIIDTLIATVRNQITLRCIHEQLDLWPAIKVMHESFFLFTREGLLLSP